LYILVVDPGGTGRSRDPPHSGVARRVAARDAGGGHARNRRRPRRRGLRRAPPASRAWYCPGHAPVGHCLPSPPHVPSTTVPRPVASGKDIAQEHKRVLDSHPILWRTVADRVWRHEETVKRGVRDHAFPLVLRERQKARDRDGGEPGLAGARLPRCTRGSLWHMTPISMVKSRARQA
jgi:hypothetical protein